MYDITIDNFHGPMDLLLHLIKQKKMNILDIKLEIIIDEYLNYIRQIENLNLNIASSYLVMASELIEIKSRMLLPKNEEDTEDEDPKERLINRLIEYEKYKNIIGDFKELELERREFVTKSPSSILEYKETEQLQFSFDLEALIDAYQKFLVRIEDEKPINTRVTKKEISVKERIMNIRDQFKINKKINFVDLFEIRTREYVIVTFLAILEMSSKREIRIIQDDNFTDIICERVE